MSVAVGDMPLQAFMDRSGTQDQQVSARRQAVRDLHHESLQVLEAMRLSGCLQDVTTAVANGGIMPDMAGGPVVRRHL